MSFVLDCSLALAWCFEDEQTPAVMALLDRLVETGAEAPALWPLESVNGLVMAERRGRISADKCVELMSFLRDLPVRLDLETPIVAWGRTQALAVRYRLSAYDAAYLELALRRGLPLATLDRALRDAAADSGVDALG